MFVTGGLPPPDVSLIRRHEELKAQLAEARALLKELEWSGLDGWVPPTPCCPVCPGQKDEMGHEPGCRLAKALGEDGA
jgi:hypothetical protein